MTNKQLKNLKDTLWTTADQLRANSGLKSTEYAEPILGLIFLRFADVKYSKFEPEIKAEFDSIKGTRMERPIHEIAIEKCGFYLPEEARYDWLLNLPESEDLAKEVKEAMEAVEKYTAELEDTLPKDIYYSVNSEDDPLVLAKLLKNFKDMNKVDENGFDIEDNFKDPNNPLQLVFVCAMWLTGFDAPSVSTLYLDKPMKGHTLMQTIARANRVYNGKECGLIIDYLDVFKYLKHALADYASDDGGLMPVKDVDNLLGQLHKAIDLTKTFCMSHDVDLNKVIEDGDTFKNLSLFEDYANTIVGNDDVKNEFAVMANTVDGLYESLRPDIFKMDFEPAYKDAILYLKGIIDGKIRPERIEAAQVRINELLDQSVITAADARKYTITEAGKELDLSKLDIDELRSQFKKLKNKNLEIVNLRKHIEEKLQKMLRRNTTRIKFAERFRNIIDEYNAGGSQNDDFYEKLLKLMEELRAEEERHIKEDLSEAELELFDLLRKEHLTADEEKRVKLAAKELYNTLTEKRKELFIVGWQNDPQPKERVKGEIVYILNKFLPESYDREIFLRKSTLVFDHIVDQAMTGYNWVA